MKHSRSRNLTQRGVSRLQGMDGENSGDKLGRQIRAGVTGTSLGYNSLQRKAFQGGPDLEKSIFSELIKQNNGVTHLNVPKNFS